MHLRPPHRQECGHACVDGCPQQQFHDQLSAPLAVLDQMRHVDRQARAAALMRGEIPAR